MYLFNYSLVVIFSYMSSLVMEAVVVVFVGVACLQLSESADQRVFFF